MFLVSTLCVGQTFRRHRVEPILPQVKKSTLLKLHNPLATAKTTRKKKIKRFRIIYFGISSPFVDSISVATVFL